MNCPTCNVWSVVLMTLNKETYIQRRRECANKHKFTTQEIVVPAKTHGGDRKSKTAKEKSNDQPIPVRQ